ncbi:MAG: prephenate dehydrogenase [Actinomycetota bacterium]|nr:prephenate dehydrogenase [Actinomycetota bacterium]
MTVGAEDNQLNGGSPFESVAVIGVGLMGGSLGMACLKRGVAARVVGFDRDENTLHRALDLGAISEAAPSSRDAAKEADLVVLATPVGAIPAAFAETLPGMPEGAIVTDVGSTKMRVVDEIGRLAPSSVEFIGGHPIAGSERHGIEAASADLYDGCFWILTPTSSTSPSSYRSLMRFLSALGARVLSLDPERHDEALALTSHLPQLLSSTLMTFAAEVATSGEGMPLLTAGGFRDMTRIAGSSEEMWVDIVKQNQNALLEVIRKFQAAFGAAVESVAAGDWEAVKSFLAAGRAARNALPGKAGVAPSELIELRVPVPDRPGVLAEVTTTVGQAGVNIEDLDIVHSPEGGRGVIHLAVRGRENARAAAEAMARKSFRVEHD